MSLLFDENEMIDASKVKKYKGVLINHQNFAEKDQNSQDSDEYEKFLMLQNQEDISKEINLGDKILDIDFKDDM